MGIVAVLISIAVLAMIFSAQASAYKCFKEIKQLRADHRAGIEAILKELRKK